MRALCVILSLLMHGIIFGFVWPERVQDAPESVQVEVREINRPKPHKLTISQIRSSGLMPLRSYSPEPDPDGQEILAAKAEYESERSNHLKSKPFLYSSFYDRMRDKIFQYWAPCAKREARRPANIWFRVLLDRHGELFKTILVESDAPEKVLDCAVGSIKKAARFPRPPSEIIDQDGLIRINFLFTIR